MFLEFNKDPKDYVTRKPDDDPDLLNEYSVFGSSPTDAVIQVGTCTCMYNMYMYIHMYMPFVQYQSHTSVSYRFAYCIHSVVFHWKFQPLVFNIICDPR